eukprot:5362661-Alexandrium_andersonii.AAC.1
MCGAIHATWIRDVLCRFWENTCVTRSQSHVALLRGFACLSTAVDVLANVGAKDEHAFQGDLRLPGTGSFYGTLK